MFRCPPLKSITPLLRSDVSVTNGSRIDGVQRAFVSVGLPPQDEGRFRMLTQEFKQDIKDNTLCLVRTRWVLVR